MAPSLNCPKRCDFYSILVSCAVFIIAPSVAANDLKNTDKITTQRVAEIFEVRHLENNKLRMIFSAQENNGIQRFPITTIDRSMIKVDFLNVSAPPADAESLMLNGSAVAEIRRAMFVGFSLHRKLRPRAIEEIRADVAELIRQLPSDLLTVAAISQDSARVIADVTPQNSDNINRITQGLQSLEPEGEGPAMADTLCVAAERFHAWDLGRFRKSDQKVLIMMSNPGDKPGTERFRAENCWRSLQDQGVRVYFVSFGDPSGVSHFDLTDVAQESGGYTHRVSGPVEANAAVKNIIALLNNEYAVDFEAPPIAMEDQPLELKVRVVYHDAIFESKAHTLGFSSPELAVGAKSQVAVDSESKGLSSGQNESIQAQIVPVLTTILAVIGILLTALLVVIPFMRHRIKTTKCSSCDVRVLRDHSDCPFRKSTCVARLVYIGGPNAGQTVPLLSGVNGLSRFRIRAHTTVISGKKIAWLHHGTINIEGAKAIYTPMKPSRDRVNGWLVSEPRLLGVGSVLRLGDQNLRFEMKPQVMTRQ